MVKFAQQGTQGYRVGLGLSHENLRRVCEQLMPIVFPASEVGLGAGKFCIGTVGMAAALREQLGSEFQSCIELNEQSVAMLLNGEPIEVQLPSLGYARAGVAMVFAGPTEEAIVAKLRLNGIAAVDANVRSPPKAPGNPWASIASGALFVGLGGIGMSNGKEVGFLVALGGAALIAWAVMMLKPAGRPR